MHIILNHGKESGPQGKKLNALRDVGLSFGYEVESIDYRSCKDEHERIDKLRSHLLELPKTTNVILVGSSMGGYVSAVVASEFEIAGLFLLCPAVYYDEFAVQSYEIKTSNIEVVHGWYDEVIPAEDSFSFSKEHEARLHLVRDNHRLKDSIPDICTYFKDFLAEGLSAYDVTD